MSDDKVITAIKKRDEKMIGLVMKKYSKLLWSVASAVLANAASVQDVEECVADVFIYLWQHPEKYSPDKGKLSSWLSMVARSKAIDRYRQLVKMKEVPVEEDSWIYSPELTAGMEAKEERQRVWACVNRLEEPEKEIIIRRFYHQQKNREIAVALGLPKKTVENRLYQAKLKIRKLLEAGGAEL